MMTCGPDISRLTKHELDPGEKNMAGISDAIYRLKRGLNWQYRLATAGKRTLPDFLIPGVQKCGTTSLFRYLSGHPEICVPSIKEIGFFHKHSIYRKGERWYRAHFPKRAELDEPPKKTVEATTYFFHPCVPKRLKKMIPGIKLIVLFRNPVDRAFSHYHHVVRAGRETLSFGDAIDAEPERMKGELEKIEKDESYYAANYSLYSYVGRGEYMIRLEKWLEHFTRSQFLFIKSEDLFSNPRDVVERTTDFLRIQRWKPESIEKHNVGKIQSKISDSLRSRLNEYFKPHNQRLYEFLGEDLGWDE